MSQIVFTILVNAGFETDANSKYLVEMSERAEGETCGDGLSWEEFKAWFSVFTTRILNADQAGAVRATY